MKGIVLLALFCIGFAVSMSVKKTDEDGDYIRWHASEPLRSPFTCNKNCWFNDWKHRDWRAAGTRMWNHRCSYGFWGGACYCYGPPQCGGRTVAAAKQPLPNVGYLAAGYDAFYGNPKTTQAGADPGFKTAIFDFSYDKGSQTSDQRYLVPDDTTFRKQEGCTLNFKSDSIQGTKKYKKSLEIDASAQGSFWGVHFSASTDFNVVHEETSKHERMFTSSHSECIAYEGFMNEYLRPNFTGDFQYAVKKLPQLYEEEKYMGFLRTFGTHYVDHVKMGAKYGKRTEFTRESWQKLLSERIKVEAAAGYDGLYSVSAKLVTQWQKEQAETFERNSKQQDTFTLGSKPPPDGNPVTWANQVIEEPMPIRYKLKPISSLFSSPRLALLREDMSDVKKGMERALQSYCEYLGKRGVGVTCKRLPPDPKPPLYHNACRFCAAECGGSFPVDGGAIVDQEFSYEAFTIYPEGCSGSMGHYNPGGSGVRLCCEPSDDSHIGTARLCTSCGGEYKYDYGLIDYFASEAVVYIHSYDNHCNGDKIIRCRPSGYEECSVRLCLTKPICEMCESCGGDFPQQTSILPAYGYTPMPIWVTARGASCSGEWRVLVSRLASLCCSRMGPTVSPATPK